mgnify:FL=1
MTRTIPLKIQNEYITGDKVLIGAAGSHNDVVLRMEFSPMWEGLTKTVQFRDALGETTIEVLLTADMLEADDTSVYLAPVPNGAKKYAGEMTLCVKGATVAGGKETRATTAVYGRFTVGESKWDTSAETEQDVPPTQAEQLQGQIENVLATIVDARKAATEAAKSAEGAALSQSRAQTSEQYAGEYAQAAANSAASASSSATAAASSATAAKASEGAAAGSATNAAASATSAGKSASEASEKASDAANSALAAATSAQTAESAGSAATDAASTASTAAKEASGSASQAQESAAAAAESAASVDDINKTAQSWAVGGTGTREGEDTNNAKYWAEQAQQAAGGGVVSFNGRAGSVVPQAGDYEKGMVGLGNVDNTSDADKPVSTKQQAALDDKQAKITASGILKGDGSGGVTAAVADTDYATPASLPNPSDTAPVMDGTAEAGTLATYARGDHKHPADTSRQEKITASGLLKGDGNGGVTAAAAGTDYSGPTAKLSLTLAAASWAGSASPYTQGVTITGGTATSQADIQADATAIQQMLDDGTNAIYIANNNGTFTAYAVGEKPTADLIVQVTVYDVKEVS